MTDIVVPQPEDIPPEPEPEAPVVESTPIDVPAPAQVAHDAATRLGQRLDPVLKALESVGSNVHNAISDDLVTVQNFLKGLV